MKCFKLLSALLVGAVSIYGNSAVAASCCGGGSSSSLIMPKMSKAMWDLSLDYEDYDGYWDKKGDYHDDPDGSEIRQIRLNLGYAKRLASRWQTSVTLPYVWNRSDYSGLNTSSDDIGDMSLNLWYEAFDGMTCVWKVRKKEDLIPASYFGMSLNLPTGVSPYDDVNSNFEITGRGFYRLDANMLIEKTIYPWSASVLLSYGHHFERDINQEYGKHVEPYKKQLGDRMSGSFTFGYTQFLDSMNTITYTLNRSMLREDEARVDGRTDSTSGMEKNTWGATVAFATMNRDWVFKMSWSAPEKSDNEGENFPATDIFTLGVTHVLR